MVNEAAQLQTAMRLQIAGRLVEAKKLYLELLEDNPESWDALHLLGLIYAESDDEATGAKLIESAIKLKPDVSAFHHNLAGIYRRLGQLAEAETEFRTAILQKPDYGQAYQGLAEMVTFQSGDPLLTQIEAQLESTTSSDSTYLHFAAGKILDDIGGYPAAFEHYRKGNAAAGRSFASKQFRQGVKDNLYCFSPELIAEQQLSSSESHQPIFVVGMPRSGTSLIEQILASHSEVFGAGELNEMKLLVDEAKLLARTQQTYPNFVSQLDDRRLNQLRQHYLEKTRHSEFPNVVDKHPLNFMYIGLIFLMFPNAKIIHTTRHPLDTCLSCYFQNFSKGQDYSFDLDTLGDFYLDYQRLMSYWHLLFPGKILDLSYEEVIDDQEPATIRLLEYCQLPFEESCLNYHQTQRSVRTASFLQVRQPIYQTSRGRWQNYEKELEGLALRIGLVKESKSVPVTISKFGRVR